MGRYNVTMSNNVTNNHNYLYREGQRMVINYDDVISWLIIRARKKGFIGKRRKMFEKLTEWADNQ